MSLWMRLLFAASGLIVIGLAAAQLHRGFFVFTSIGLHQTTFAASGIGTGFLLMLIGLLPPGRWLYPRITTKRTYKEHVLDKHATRHR